jgi:hypothetical protein
MSEGAGAAAEILGILENGVTGSCVLVFTQW